MSPKGLAASVCFGALFAIGIALVALGFTRSWGFERELFWLRASGWCALGALLLSLSASPLGLLVRAFGPHVPAFRRALGISAAASATLHGALALRSYLAASLPHLLDHPWMRGGVAAWAILLALWITSSPRIVARLRVRAWKPLHRLAYVAALFALQHTLLSPMAPRAWVLGLFGAALVLGALRLLRFARRPRTVHPVPRDEQ